MLKHPKYWRRFAVVLAGAATAVFAATAASAAPAPHATHFGKSGVAGYEVTTNRPLNNLTAVLHPDATFANIGNVGVGGAGGQFCDPNNDYAAQLGIVATSPTTEAVDYQAGFLGGCADFGVLQNPLSVNTALTNLTLGDNVQVWMSHFDVKVVTHHNGHWTSCKRNGKVVEHCKWHKGFNTTSERTRILFQAQDVTTGSEVFSKTITAPGVEYFDSTGWGVQQDTTGMSACSPVSLNHNVAGLTSPETDGTCNQVVTIEQPFASGISFFELSTSPIQEWVTSAGGLTTNPVLVGPGGPSRDLSFTIWAGNATV